ncbi:MAG: hypothetical protein ACLT38_12940 [Akkermansia sp.]
MSRGGTKSTVGTVTEIWQFMRLLYAKLGQAYCPRAVFRWAKVGIGSGGAGGEGAEKHGGLALLAPSSGDARHYADLARWAEGRDMRKCGWTANWFP